MLADAGTEVDALYSRPHEAGSCDCRKPEPGLFLRAATDHPAIDFGASAMVGDSVERRRGGRAARDGHRPARRPATASRRSRRAAPITWRRRLPLPRTGCSSTPPGGHQCPRETPDPDDARLTMNDERPDGPARIVFIAGMGRSGSTSSSSCWAGSKGGWPAASFAATGTGSRFRTGCAAAGGCSPSASSGTASGPASPSAASTPATTRAFGTFSAHT